MPVHPSKSGVHKLACLSLYRTLLRQCTRLGQPGVSRRPVDVTNTDRSRACRREQGNVLCRTLRSLVQHRFHKDRGLLSPTAIENGLVAGARFSSLLSRCASLVPSTSHAALGELRSLLVSTATKAESTADLRAHFLAHCSPTAPARLAHVDHLRRVANKSLHKESAEPRIFSAHPASLASLRGRRRVPHLHTTQGIPMLRYGKPDPVLLQRVIKQKTLWGVRKFQQHLDMQNGEHWGALEDEWDARLLREHGIGPGKGDTGGDHLGRIEEAPRSAEPTWSGPKETVRMKNLAAHLDVVGDSWSGTFDAVDRYLGDVVMERRRGYAALGAKMWEVVVAERELKEKERREAKHLRRMERKRSSEGRVDGD